MLASEAVADEGVPVEAVETKCLVVIIIPRAGHTLQGHLLAGHQRGMWFIIRVVTTLEADLVGLSLDLRM
jgi:hypothetical protein